MSEWIIQGLRGVSGHVVSRLAGGRPIPRPLPPTWMRLRRAIWPVHALHLCTNSWNSTMSIDNTITGTLNPHRDTCVAHHQPEHGSCIAYLAVRPRVLVGIFQNKPSGQCPGPEPGCLAGSEREVIRSPSAKIQIFCHVMCVRGHVSRLRESSRYLDLNWLPLATYPSNTYTKQTPLQPSAI